MYNHKIIESKWQKHWKETKAFRTTNDSNKKAYILDMFPYPSGSGLHVGHPEGYTATDILARYKRLNGFDVLHPMGYDAFGLPAEQYAIKTGNDPESFTKKNINNFRRQLESLGFSYDPNKELSTTDPSFYKITQWIFSQMYKKGLAEIKEIDVNWCEKLGTVLANEEIVKDANGNNVSERGSFPVIKKPMKQWVLKITKYADRLFDDLKDLNWSDGLKSLQKNWIKNEDGSLHIRDWIFSRQRYWGEPFPIAFDENGEIYLIDELPVLLPKIDNIKPSGTGESPLANITDWLEIEIDGKKLRRETNTMPQWAGSSWYYLGYILKNEDGSFTDIESKEAKERFKKWLPVDLYVGGQEHATLHLIYARFWHKVLYDLGIVPTKEPFQKIINQGMILGPDGSKMSKSKGNVINPDDIVNEFGADTLRLYEMFMGPIEDTKPWSTEGVKGIRKWLDRVYRMYEIILDKDNNSIRIKNSNNSKISSYYHKFVRDITKDINEFKFNTAISKMMVFVNDVYKIGEIKTINYLEAFAVILSVFAPHISEQLLQMIGVAEIANQKWPLYDPKKIIEDEIEIAVQVNGKLRATIKITKEVSKEEVITLAKKNDNVKKHINAKKIIKEIYVPLKIINIVVK